MEKDLRERIDAINENLKKIEPLEAGRIENIRKRLADQLRESAAKDAVDKNRFEQEDREFYNRVAHGYSQIAKREAHRVVVITATGSIEESHRQIIRTVEERFPEIIATNREQTAGVKK